MHLLTLLSWWPGPAVDPPDEQLELVSPTTVVAIDDGRRVVELVGEEV
ncbi:MAG: hypothetical protein AB7G37_03460 [Solirubrobacteraceae bacterium]